MAGQLIPEIGRDYLRAELRAGLAFTMVAHLMPDYGDKVTERCVRSARAAYNNYCLLRANGTLSDSESEELQHVVKCLEVALRELGEEMV